MFPGFKVMIVGDSGVGKTYSIRTLVDSGITPFIIFTENGMRSLGDVPKESLHWHYLPPADLSWGDMKKIGQSVNTSTYEDLAANKAGLQKQKHTQLLKLFDLCDNFVCQRTGKEFGPISKWGTDRALILDSLSGLALMAKGLTVGAKPTLHQGEWNVAMNQIEGVVNKFCMQLYCHFVLIAHSEREMDPVAGSVKIYPSSLGAKLSPKLPRYFDEVVYADKIDGKFTWATAHRMAVTKNRNLPYAESLPPTFRGIVDGWKKAGGEISPMSFN